MVADQAANSFLLSLTPIGDQFGSLYHLNGKLVGRLFS